MKKLIFLLLFLSQAALSETKISGLPLLGASDVTTTDYFPFVNITANETARLKLSDILKAPSITGFSLLGDLLYGGSSGTRGLLSGPTAAHSYALTETGTGSAAAAPIWTQYTSTNTASTIVQRDSSGGFSAGVISPTSINVSGLSASQAVFTDSSGTLVSNAKSGTGSVAMTANTVFTGTTTLATASPAALTLNVAPSSILSTNSSNQVAAASTTGSGPVCLATSPTLVTPALGTPSALVGTNITGTAASLTAGHVTTNANLTGPITSVGNATSVASQTGTGSTFAMSVAPAFTGTTTFVTASPQALTVNVGPNAVLGTDSSSQVTAATTTGTGSLIRSTSPTLGSNGTVSGAMTFANGSTGGAGITVQNRAATTAYNLNLPSTAGVVGQILTSGGGGNADMTWVSNTALNNPMTTQGDIIYESAGLSATRLAVGSSNSLLGVSGGQPAYVTSISPASVTINAGTGQLVATSATGVLQSALLPGSSTYLKAPTFQKFTTPTAACLYLLPQSPSPLYLEVIATGAGGGGGGSGTSAQGNGGLGGTTSFGTNLLTLSGGAGGQGGNSPGGAGGSPFIAASLSATSVGYTGGSGQGGAANISAGSAQVSIMGGSGGNNPLGGAGAGGAQSTAGSAGVINTGGGGGGGGTPYTANGSGSGAGGGAGAYIRSFISSPSSSYTCQLGTGGTAGSAGSGGFAGGPGAHGGITVIEHYQ